MNRLPTILRKTQISVDLAKDFLNILIGAVLQALSLRIFLVPAHLASGGVSGLSQIINHYSGFPIGLMVFIGNLPLLIVGYRYLGGARFIIRTAAAVTFFSFLVDIPIWFIPENGVTQDLMLNALYGGVTSGVGFGFVYRGRGTSGGTDILAKILSRWRGISISQSYLLTDSIIMFLAGIAFSWEHALYALVMLYVSGIAADAITRGSNIVRTAMIVTSKPDSVSRMILDDLGRGATIIEGKGGFTGEEKTIIYCVISRAEVSRLKTLVEEIDEHAFMVIGQANEALGEGFQTLKNQ